MTIKPLDRFSGHAALYARYRIEYPTELYDFVLAHVPSRYAAWDCATGNGQVAGTLANHFVRVDATDISQSQLDLAVQRQNIHYAVSAAEKTPFADASFDLVTVGQALHWFNVLAFNAEVRRVLKPGGVVAEWGYGLNQVGPEIDALVQYFYQEVVGPFWDPQRKHTEDEYTSLAFPFAHAKRTTFVVRQVWDAERFLNYLRTWSSVQKYRQHHGSDPVDGFASQLQYAWGPGERDVQFPVFLRLGHR